MKDIQKIKEFFSKPLNEATFKVGDKVTYLGHPGEITGVSTDTSGRTYYSVSYKTNTYTGRRTARGVYNKGGEIKLAETVAEYFKPLIRKDKSNPNFLYVDIAYPAGSGVLSVGGSKTMGGQDREAGAVKALSMGNNIAKKLQSKYNIEDIDVSDLENGKVEVFAVSDDFIKMSSPSLDEAKSEDKVDTITMDIPLFLRMLEYSREDASQDMDLHDVTEKANKLGKERGILSMEDYDAIVSAAEDTPKGEMKEMDYGSVLMRNLMPGANDLKKYVDILIKDPKIETSSSEQEFRSLLRDKVERARFFGNKDEISQAAERILAFGNNNSRYSDTITRVFNMIKNKSVNETVNLKASKLSTAEYQKAKKLKDFKANDWKWNADEDLYTKVVKETTDYMKRRKAMDDYAISKKDKPAKPYNPTPSGKTDYMKRRQKEIAEAIIAKLKK